MNNGLFRCGMWRSILEAYHGILVSRICGDVMMSPSTIQNVLGVFLPPTLSIVPPMQPPVKVLLMLPPLPTLSHVS